jgi:hypothetical protein
MPERVLCNDGLSVTVGGAGSRTLIEVKGVVTARFWCDTTVLEETLEGMPVQLSSFEGFCFIECDKGQIRLEFQTRGSGKHMCRFPCAEFADALKMVRETDLLDGDFLLTSEMAVENPANR